MECVRKKNEEKKIMKNKKWKFNTKNRISACVI